METEGERSREVAGVHGQVAGVGAGRRARAPQQPAADAPLVLGLVTTDVVAEVQENVRRLDPRPGRDVAVALGRGREVVGVERGGVLRPLVVAEVGFARATSRGRSTPGGAAA